MRRRRDIAVAPRRGAPETWQTIVQLVGETVGHSEHFERADVELALEPVGVVGRMLIAAGHLERNPVVLVAGTARIDIFTIDGSTALTLNENLHAAPGTIGATDWMLYLPQVDPLAKLTRQAVEGHAHLSADPPVTGEDLGADRKAASLLDLDALALWAKEES